MLAWVHGRARSLRRRRTATRLAPVAASALALVMAVTQLGGSTPQSLRTADGMAPPVPEVGGGTGIGDGTGLPSVEELESRAVEAARPLTTVVTTPLRDEDVPQVPVPIANPPQRAAEGKQWTRVVDDPAGDESPDHDHLDIRSGDLDYDRGRDVLWFRTGLTAIGNGSTSSNLTWTFGDDGQFRVEVFQLADQAPHVKVQGETCGSCTVVVDAGARLVDAGVPAAVLNFYWDRDIQGGTDRIGVGATVRNIKMTATGTKDDGYWDPAYFNPLGGNDQATADRFWTIE